MSWEPQRQAFKASSRRSSLFACFLIESDGLLAMSLDSNGQQRCLVKILAVACELGSEQFFITRLVLLSLPTGSEYPDDWPLR
jgi:hypothetical protein